MKIITSFLSSIGILNFCVFFMSKFVFSQQFSFCDVSYAARDTKAGFSWYSLGPVKTATWADNFLLAEAKNHLGFLQMLT